MIHFGKDALDIVETSASVLPAVPNAVYEVGGSDIVHALLMLLNGSDNFIVGAVIAALGAYAVFKRKAKKP